MSTNFKLTVSKFIKSENLPYIQVMMCSLACFIILTMLVILNIKQVISFDNFAVANFNSFAIKRPAEPVVFITNLGSVQWVCSVAFLIVLGLIRLKRVKEIFFFFMTIGGAGFLTVTLKWLIGRSRPALDSPLVHADWYGFPSGHTTLATCFYGALIYLACIYIKDKWLKILIITFLAFLILLIGISRVYLGAHFPTDVLAGFAIGTFWVAFSALVYKSNKRKSG